jgi:uncharacterized protein (TIGR03067 family)
MSTRVARDMLLRMRIQHLAAALLLLVCSFSFADEKADKEIAKLTGEWKVESATFDGNAVPAQQSDLMGFTIEGKKIVAKANPNDPATLTIDPLATPAVMDTTDAKGTVNPGIYKLEGEKLTICSAWPGDPRPAAFESPKGKRYVLMVATRVVKK